MAIKDKVLELLDDNKGKYLSGEQLADTLGCTRGAVWKAVKALQENGYPISAVTNKGYSLDENTDILSLAGIKKYLDPDRQGGEECSCKVPNQMARRKNVQAFHAPGSAYLQ